MTFNKFEEIVINRYPHAEVTAHGEFSGNKINVAVIFTPGGKVYKYNGSYCEVLNKLHIPAVYKHVYENIITHIKQLEEKNGKEDQFFGLGIIDNTQQIKEYRNRLLEIETTCVIC